MRFLLPLLLLPFAAFTQGICNEDANIIIYSNYDGGTLNLNIDEDVPGLKIGICSYEPITVNLSGTYAGNVSEVVWAGYTIGGTSVNGVDAGIVELQQYPAATLSDPDGNSFIVCAYECDTAYVPGGCNTVDQITEYFLTLFGGALRYSHMQYGVWASGTYNISDGGNCCFTTGCTANIDAGGNQIICEGDSLLLSASGGLEYSWTANGEEVECLDASCYAILVAPVENTMYEVTGTDGLGCTGSATVNVTVNAAPNIELTFDGTTLYASGGIFYTWLLNGEVIDGPTGNTYIPLVSGEYEVFGLGTNDCSSLSNTIDVIADMIPQTGHDTDLVLFPNPAEEKITLVWDGRHPLESIGVYDLTGKCLKLEYVANPKSEFSLEGIAPQFLMIVCTDTNGEIYLRPIVKR